MGNKITEKYFEQEDFSQREKEVLEVVCAETGFAPQEEIFRGVIYDADKVGSLIYKGVWKHGDTERPAVLKLQGLQPEVDEIDILGAFAAQSESSRVRLPELYAGKKWNAQEGYGYLLLEYVGAPQIYTNPLATEQQIAAFCDFYTEYRLNAVREAFVEPEVNSSKVAEYAEKRMRHWATIAEAQGNATPEDIASVERYVEVIKEVTSADVAMDMEFQHAHLTADDIFDMGDGPEGREYVLMSNLFWGWRPQWYDTTFHLWAGIKAVRSTEVTVEHIMEYIQKWLDAYTQVPVITDDTDFEKKFWLLIAGRALGTILIDAHNQDYTLPNANSEQQEDYESHMKAHVLLLFRHILDHAFERVK